MMNEDKLREEFEKSEYFEGANNWVKWDGKKYIKTFKGFNELADRWANKMNHEFSIFKAGAESQLKAVDEMIKDRDSVHDDNEKLRQKVESLKVKANQYAKRLVNLGEDDVSWEIKGE